MPLQDDLTALIRSEERSHVRSFLEANREQIQSFINLTDSRGFTPIQVAALYGRFEDCRLLVEARANVFAYSNDGQTILDCAQVHKGDTRTPIIEFLLQQGAGLFANLDEQTLKEVDFAGKIIIGAKVGRNSIKDYAESNDFQIKNIDTAIQTLESVNDAAIREMIKNWLELRLEAMRSCDALNSKSNHQSKLKEVQECYRQLQPAMTSSSSAGVSQSSGVLAKMFGLLGIKKQDTSASSTGHSSAYPPAAKR